MVKLNRIYVIGILFYLSHLVISSANDIITKYLGQNLGVHEVVFFRFLFACITLLPFMLKDFSSFKTNRITVHAIRGLLLYGGIGLWVFGLRYVQVSTAVVINFTIPIFILLLASMFLKEKIGMHRWVATFFAFLGVIVVNDPTSGGFNAYGIALLAASVMFASLDVINKFFVVKETMLGMLFYSSVFTTLFSAYPASQEWVTPTSKDMILFFVLGGGANLLLFFLLKSFEKIDVSSIAPLRYFELIISSIFAYLVFGDIPDSSTIFGAMIIIPSTLFVVMYDARKKRRSAKK
ncbi:MAG: DMT family transporter [Rickettsiales bacterium]